MKFFYTLFFLFTFAAFPLQASPRTIDFSMVISGGVSLGAYESGYNWAMIKMMKNLRQHAVYIKPELRAVAGASAGSINALLTTLYWCQKEDVPLKNSVEDNLFYDTWVDLGIEDLMIKGEDPHNKSSLFSRRVLRKKAQKIIAHLQKDIYKKGCEVALGVSVTKATPIVEDIAGIQIKNQHFSIPFTMEEYQGHMRISNRKMPPSTDFYLSIPGIEHNASKMIDVLFASSAFPGVFQQVKLDYVYKGKPYKNYFIDGGAYDNVPLQLAIELDRRSHFFLFMDPSNMRKEPKQKEEETEQAPIGFFSSNTLPLLNTLEIFQSMKLYEAINKYFRGHTDNSLILSSRYHPLTGNYLEHFAAFLDKNFRQYDYQVGVYDALYNLAKKLRTEKHFSGYSQEALMQMLQKKIGIDKNPDAKEAFKLFMDTEFHHIRPKTDNRYTAIYNAFNLQCIDRKRYGFEAFKTFLSKLDMHYLPTPKRSFLRYAKKDIDNWYKKPLRFVVNRITTLENDRAKVYPDYRSFATLASVSAWAGSTFIKDKEGFEFLPLNAPDDGQNGTLRTALRLLPGGISTDMKNGGMSMGYTALYHLNKPLISGFEGKASYVLGSHTPDFVRFDLGAYSEYSDVIKFGAGASLFGDTKGKFYKKESAYGYNTYVDLLDIFRLTYVHRGGDLYTNDYLYFGIENIPSLLYWLSR
ncbi:patatin-like phospholipase family protein [Sulfurovum sp.]|uniref:patatin-like phospholipase family protein n=1 Tax=Sulfurovum sp. TaxID=1969726 RepID=UPI0025F8D7D9|nr:patatin-like phospholipase family protein [Sulfurovum sp.]